MGSTLPIGTRRVLRSYKEVSGYLRVCSGALEDVTATVYMRCCHRIDFSLKMNSIKETRSFATLKRS